MCPYSLALFKEKIYIYLYLKSIFTQVGLWEGFFIGESSLQVIATFGMVETPTENMQLVLALNASNIQSTNRFFLIYNLGKKRLV